MNQKYLPKLLDEVKEAYLALNPKALYLYKYQENEFLLQFTENYNHLIHFTWNVIAQNHTPTYKTPYHLRLPPLHKLAHIRYFLLQNRRYPP